MKPSYPESPQLSGHNQEAEGHMASDPSAGVPPQSTLIIEECFQEIQELRERLAALESPGEAASEESSDEEPPLDIEAPEALLSNLRKESEKLLGKKKSLKKLKAEIAQSGLFSNDFYRSSYPDIVDSGLDPLDHFLLHGAAEGRNPSQDFHTLFYLQANPDVAEAGINPLLHFIQFGKAEDRPTRPAA
jgi:hypothetical protein